METEKKGPSTFIFAFFFSPFILTQIYPIVHRHIHKFFGLVHAYDGDVFSSIVVNIAEDKYTVHLIRVD